MKVGEIWESKEEQEQVIIDYIEYNKEFNLNDGYFIGYTYLQEPKDHEQPDIEEMVSREWFVANFIKCQRK